MIRSLVIILVFAAVFVFFAVVVCIEHRPQSVALPMVQAATQGDEASANRLFAPCPITPANIPFPQERKT